MAYRDPRDPYQERDSWRDGWIRPTRFQAVFYTVMALGILLSGILFFVRNG
ncbi:hypothetical protein [Yinghuangia soli]|uniref:Uncharacterized protein n=1 Tax=Yinghuangia soli TaxID=2908204 RepID=A0AA41PTZ1_9ACTN|nr:hypothetical protein [Yinghuangia soli]MCF2525656.1 hypothetical protein [Yinghuangia soli]